jgi:hypothetical protein
LVALRAVAGCLGAFVASCQCGFDAGKLDRLACTTAADCRFDQECESGTCVQRGCVEAEDCGRPGLFACVDRFCEALGDGDADADVDGDVDAGSDADSDGDVDGDAGSDAGVDAGVDAGEPDAGALACVDDAVDIAAVYDADDDPGTDAVDLLTISHGCALECVQGGPDCFAKCVTLATDGALESPCVDCLEAAAGCGVSNCLGSCFGDPHRDACITCACDHCDPEFENCGGVASPWCPH